MISTFCSTVIPTVARPSLSRAVQSVLDQEFDESEFEVIVVNDSGKPLPEAGWQHSERVHLIHTNRRERIFARNSGAAIAKGEYLHFLDDDDWLLPGALQAFWELAQGSRAHWLYGSSQLYDRQGKALIQLHHGLNGNCFIQVMAGEWIPLQSSLIKAEAFFAIGGFTPLVDGAEDMDLSRRILLHGDVAETSKLVAGIGMGVQNSTTDYDRASEYSRWAREKILNEPGVWSRLRDSARTSEWKGRIPRIYLTSVVWNLKQKHIFTALSRMSFGAIALVLSGTHMFSPAFWAGILHNYQSSTFQRGFQEAGLEPERADNRLDTIR
jgi:glycosyltransferase involved in cell wall biosynthesis